jgi:hypothetical protein
MNAEYIKRRDQAFQNVDATFGKKAADKQALCEVPL